MIAAEHGTYVFHAEQELFAPMTKYLKGRLFTMMKVCKRLQKHIVQEFKSC